MQNQKTLPRVTIISIAQVDLLMQPYNQGFTLSQEMSLQFCIINDKVSLYVYLCIRLKFIVVKQYVSV